MDFIEAKLKKLPDIVETVIATQEEKLKPSRKNTRMQKFSSS
jgi:hypothetical protein